MRLEGKNGLVTAAGSGMGRAGAVRFAKEGASVGVVDIDETAVQAVVAEIEADGGKAVGIVRDLTKDDDCAASCRRPRMRLVASISCGIMSAILGPRRLKVSR